LDNKNENLHEGHDSVSGAPAWHARERMLER